MKATEIPGLNFTTPPTTKLSVLVAASSLYYASAQYVKNDIWQGHRPTCIGVLEGGAFADELAALRPDDGLVYIRGIGVHGDGNHREIAAWGGPKGYIDWIRKEFSNRSIYVQFLNESGVEHDDDVPGQIPKNVKCAMEGIEYAYSIGQPIMFNLHGMGGPEDYQIPMLYPLYELASQINADGLSRGMNNGRPMVIAGFDEYYPNFNPWYIGWRPCQQQDDGAIHIDDNPNVMTYHKAHNFMTFWYRWVNNDFTQATSDDPNDMFWRNNWYQFRFARLYQRLIERGIAIPALLKEFGADDLVEAYKGFRNGLTEDQFADHLIGMMEKGYHVLDESDPLYPYSQYVIGATLFIMGNPGGWKNFNLWQEGSEPPAYHLFERLKQYAMKSKITIPVEPKEMKIYKNIQEFNINIRYSPNKGAAVVGSIVPGQEVEMDENSQVLAEGYYWLQTVDGNWAAWKTETGVVWLEVQGTVDPEPGPEPMPSEYVTNADFQDFVEAIWNAIDALNAPDWRKIAEAARLTRIAHEQAAEAWGIIETELTPEETT